MNQYYYFDLPEFIQKYDIEQNRLLGKGYDANVYLVKSKTSPTYYALKCSNIRDQQHIYNFHMEIQLYHLIKQHPHIVQFVGNSKDFSCILLEFMPYGNLSKLLSLGAIPFRLVKLIIFQVIQATNYLHSINVIHGDIKPENTLISYDFTVKIADFGFAKYLKTPGPSQLRGGSEGFVAPECNRQGKYDCTKCDVFSIGVMFFVLTTGLRPYLSNYPAKKDQYWMLIENQEFAKFWDIFKSNPVTESFKSCFQAMIMPKWEQRCTLNEIINHQVFKEDMAEPAELRAYFQERFSAKKT